MVKKRDVKPLPRRASFSAKKGAVLNQTITKVLSCPASTTSIKSNSSANIKVVVRVRPQNTREEEGNNRSVVQVVNDDFLIFDPEEDTQGFFFHGVQQKGRDLLKKVKKNMKFFFDKIFATDATNSDIFKGSTYPLISSVMDGYNCSVFAYGATGAGKTFTMTGTADNPGITFLTMTELFKQQEELSTDWDFDLGITYLEVYNELVKDLLNPGPPLNLREDSNYGVIVAGIKVFKISNADELFHLLEQGNRNRTQHPTDANAESSRSHAVFQVYIKMMRKTTKQVRTAKLSMIDLAGSERGSVTGYGGARFTEGANINKSLLALGNCINSLADGQRHVPYRDSKLTRLLKDSLGGNCKTVMIANVSPSSLSFEDTYNTLKYATRAKKIKSNIHMNVAKVDLNIIHYVKMIEDLTTENKTLKQQLKEEVDKREILEVECQRLKSEVEIAGFCADVNDEAFGKIKVLMHQQKEILERQFKLEQNHDFALLRSCLRSTKQKTDAEFCYLTPIKNRIRDGLKSDLPILPSKENNLEHVHKDEALIVNIDKQVDDILSVHPQHKQYVKMERMKLSLLKAKHVMSLESKESEALIAEQKEKNELIEKMAVTMKYFYQLLQGHGVAPSNVTKQYQEISQSILGRKHITWGPLPDSGISSEASIAVSDLDEMHENKRKTEDEGNQTFSMPSKPTKTPDLFRIKGRNNITFARPVVRRTPAKNTKDKENKENGYRKPFDSTKTSVTTAKSTAKSLLNSGFKGNKKH
ncbi:kinesin-like protein KIF18A isoform X2 [Diabrotica virgifera virgifera]|uniref:Kinesin-like protein n=1 Tax=Diabrotica virgifera virgifera TaxID=50390 RepID=A0ABM5K8Q2_DIAVI|nr:kinesin-like protein KIF18A isoform X2 [Diabrotica virgifera virgifera]